MQSNGVFDVLDGLFVSVALAIAALEGRTRNEIPVSIAFDDNWKSNVFHDYDDYRSVSNGGKQNFLGRAR
jgi:hypothetical protein